jgi:hypothetical protein
MAIGGAVVSLFTGVQAIVSGDASMESSISIVLLLLLSTSLGVALGIQGVTYGRAARYATAMPDLLRLTERISRQNPEMMSGNDATEICDRVVDALAKILTQISGAHCHVSIEILTRTLESSASFKRRAEDYVVLNLSRDSMSEGLDHEDKRRRLIEDNSSYSITFHDPSCSAFFFRDDVAADSAYRTSEMQANALPAARGVTFRRGRWPLHYRSTLVVKICQAELCRLDREHSAVGFLWLRSPEPGVFDERYDVELMQRISRAVAPIVTRCVQATKPSYDFRRRRTAAQ